MTDETLRDQRILVIFAHPDDESFQVGGTLARLRELGAEVTLVTATRGEVGQILIDEGVTPENLAAVREAELRNAMNELDVHDVRFLSYRDSGMEGTDDNQHPNAFCKADPERQFADVLELVKDIQPTAMITFNEDGVYLHPDHLAVHRMVVSGLDRIGREHPELLPVALYLGSVPRSGLRQFMDDPDGPFSNETDERKALMGTPDERITHSIDISSVSEKKRRAIMAHRTQTGDVEPFQDLPPEVREAFLSKEFFQYVALRPAHENEETDPIGLLQSSATVD